MKRNLLVVAATSSMLALAAPPLALAQGRHHHHGARHASTHKRGHRAHVLRFGGSLSGSPSGTAPTLGSPSTGEPAGTVVSFTEGVLTIKLTGKSGAAKVTEVSGKVTERTELQCEPAAGAGEGSDEQQGSGDDQDRSEGAEDGATSETQDSGQHVAMAQSSDVGDDQGEEQDGEEACTAAALKPGAVVLGAELRIGDSGAVWEEIQLQK